MKFSFVRNPRAARFACCSNPFMVYVGVAALVQHFINHSLRMRLEGSYQFLDRLQPRALSPGQPALEPVTRVLFVIALGRRLVDLPGTALP